MSNSLAIATVTAALCHFLTDALRSDNKNNAFGGASVTPRRPEAIMGSGKNSPDVGIFLYLVTPNAAWRNTDIMKSFPAAEPPDYIRPPGFEKKPQGLVRRPQVPLNLSYLFSFYGDEGKLQPQLLLGKVVSAIHAHPRLSPGDIRNSVTDGLYSSYLKGSDLAEQVENIEYVTLSPINLNLEELSKIWSVFFQAPYILSVAYTASTVLLEPGAPQKAGYIEKVNVDPVAPEIPPKSSRSAEVLEPEKGEPQQSAPQSQGAAP